MSTLIRMCFPYPTIEEGGDAFIRLFDDVYDNSKMPIVEFRYPLDVMLCIIIVDFGGIRIIEGQANLVESDTPLLEHVFKMTG